ncbi:hypothetical protein LDENG_00153680, partial [Lucifuga dentata]
HATVGSASSPLVPEIIWGKVYSNLSIKTAVLFLYSAFNMLVSIYRLFYKLFEKFQVITVSS